ncbi:zinc finger HIT domain-containing protein 3-like [Gigantopelta aegis]|uniref:zinc finger HIT domain-containing protein 3-like n=1 Tax=Gigantopelta aegis TaxID=1735272 RepID=UPI001B88E025|nr:zinc finger HIT domain-containing protein 3-like [Gigantopelta aegis]
MNNKIQSVQCEVCRKEVSKYKCPKCVARYCSVGCYKSHKENNCSPLKIINNNLQKAAVQLAHSENTEVKNKEDGEISDSEEEFADSEDKVSLEKLKSLGESEHMLGLLENPHLRTIMKSLHTSANPKQEMDMAMKEPIFAEFADECLTLVDQEKT